MKVTSRFRIYGKQVPLASGETVTADDQYMRDSILLPRKQISAGYNNLIPSFSGHISEAEIMPISAPIIIGRSSFRGGNITSI